jgi:hypothetical protein
VFAFSRIYQKEEPSFSIQVAMMIAILLLSYISWKYVEKPFRNKSRVNGKVFLITLTICSIGLVGFGYSAHKSHGFFGRVFDKSVSATEMHTSYNQRNFTFEADSFRTDLHPKILVIGNSFGRDIINVLRETYDFTKLELVYSDDYNICSLFQSDSGEVLYSEADIIVFASNYEIKDTRCINKSLQLSNKSGARIFFVGTKQFGLNLNWIVRTELNEKKLLRNPVLQETINADKRVAKVIPPKNYISIMRPLSNSEGVIVTDQLGRLISPDRIHLTRYGAIYIGKQIILKSELGKALDAFAIHD